MVFNFCTELLKSTLKNLNKINITLCILVYYEILNSLYYFLVYYMSLKDFLTKLRLGNCIFKFSLLYFIKY